MQDVFGGQTGVDQDEWISVSDLMTVLMVIFLFIAIAFIKSTKDLAEDWYVREGDIYRALDNEFRDDFNRWNAELLPHSLVIRFKDPEVLFEKGKSELREKFRVTLDDFFPRYAKVLSPYKLDIEEIRIEGHTSSDWGEEPSELEAYFQNMKLSQDRTRAVLNFAMRLGQVEGDKEWLLEKLTANGLSSSRLVTIDGKEDAERSRRVEFSVRTNAIEVLEQIRGLETER